MGGAAWDWRAPREFAGYPRRGSAARANSPPDPSPPHVRTGRVVTEEGVRTCEDDRSNASEDHSGEAVPGPLRPGKVVRRMYLFRPCNTDSLLLQKGLILREYATDR